MTISMFFADLPFGVLPYKAWIPYSYEKVGMYWFTFCLQLLAVLIVGQIAIGCDTTIYGFFTLICAQFRILVYRLDKAINTFEIQAILNSEKTMPDAIENCENQIIHCIKYHRAILE